MDILGGLASGFAVALTPTNLALAFLGCFVGTIIGALPGIGPVNGVAILIPLAFSFQLDPASALILLSCVYYGCMYGGRISSIMLNIPGDEPAIMTTLDGYPMARQGKATEALAISAVASFVGATLATVGLTLFSPLLARAAIHFGPSDYFALYVMAFATIGGVTGANPCKTLLAAFLGLMLATVGLDPASGTARYTFGSFNLYDGFDPIVAIVGLFAISEVLIFLETSHKPSGGMPPLGRMFAGLKDVRRSFGAMLRGSGLGFVAGILPGAGASLGAFLAYVFERRWSNRNDTFGKGDPRGVAAPEAGNNAAAGGALIPMLTLGIPGSGTTAVMLALLISLNITPGPLLFERQPEMVWGLIASLYIANVVLLVLNLPLVGLFTRMLSLPAYVLMPFVVMVSFLGIYSISNSTFDLLVMIGFGLLGFVMRKLDISLVPLVLGLLLGADMENNLRRALSISNGDFSILFESPIALVIYAITAVALLVAFGFAFTGRRIAPPSEKDAALGG
ncbi:tripartite tricarboxylate transporter permease [Aurantimonas sp. HBX-1]|uniref:tripartite tricarboxylate transporter permease n=1 Tax=Aurantimonas sp. HBX-1 TaxID=2906072 RepID=UPI001F3079FD|nr:tripartite tricarboxylate transporter permease [Aurantimonas sp. HBX-1]UIJ74159.1 tripartite tricarboxylate transporter permease [Aurantimonas sp. HBX-1]